jgi:hypothetical protein
MMTGPIKAVKKLIAYMTAANVRSSFVGIGMDISSNTLIYSHFILSQIEIL